MRDTLLWGDYVSKFSKIYNFWRGLHGQLKYLGYRAALFALSYQFTDL